MEVPIVAQKGRPNRVAGRASGGAPPSDRGKGQEPAGTELSALKRSRRRKNSVRPPPSTTISSPTNSSRPNNVHFWACRLDAALLSLARKTADPEVAAAGRESG